MAQRDQMQVIAGLPGPLHRPSSMVSLSFASKILTPHDTSWSGAKRPPTFTTSLQGLEITNFNISKKRRISAIANAHVQRTAVKYSVAMNRIQTRLGFALRRGIVKSLLKRLDTICTTPFQ